MKEIEAFTRILKENDNIVFFGGAGVSTESNIPDFRSNQGLYKKKTYPYPAEQMISHDFYLEHTKEFYDFYFHEMVFPEAVPNDAHIALASLEEMGNMRAIITQNIDGLHLLAGSKTVYELHGSIHRNYCTGCHKFYDLDAMLQQQGQVPHCNECSGRIKPDVVLYGEGLQQEVMASAIQAIAHADVMIVGGTSLVVYPAASLLQYFKGHTIVLINKDATSMDEKANIIIREPIGSVFNEVMKSL